MQFLQCLSPAAPASTVDRGLRPRVIQSLWLKKLFVFPSIDDDIIFECFNEFVKSAPSLQSIDELIKYLRLTYFSPIARYSPVMWANILRNSDYRTTTNGCESFHNHFGNNFRSSNPNIFVFIENLKDHNTLAKIKSKSNKSCNTQSYYSDDLKELEILRSDTNYIHNFLENTYETNMLPVTNT